MSRINSLGASEVAALFGCDPYTTQLQLYYKKTGEISDEADKPVMRLGKYLEPFVLKEVFPEHEPHPQDVKVYYGGDEASRIHATPDAYITINGVRYLIECKTVSSIPPEPHPHHTLQCQQQMLCTEISNCLLLYYDRATAEHEVFTITADDVLQQEIVMRARSFWGSVEMRIPPEPQAKDVDTLRTILNPGRQGEERVITDNNWLKNVIYNYKQSGSDKNELESAQKKAKADILAFMHKENLSVIHTDDMTIKLSVSTVPERTQTVKEHTKVMLTVKPRRDK